MRAEHAKNTRCCTPIAYTLYLIPYTLYPISLRRIGDWGKKEKAADESDLNPD